PGPLPAGTVTDGALDGLRERDGRRSAANRVEEIDRERRLDVRPLLGGGGGSRARAASENVAEDVLEARIAAATARPEATAAHASHRLLRALELARTLGVEAGLQALVAELVVRLTLGLVGEDVVRERDALELL